jgi:L-lactate dehydrogenase complex protein LldG
MTSRAISARDEVLARVRAAGLRGGSAADAPRDYLRGGTGVVSLDLFAARLRDYHAQVRRCAPADIGATVADSLAGARSVIRPAGVPKEWTADLPVLLDDPPLTITQLDGAAAVVTSCAVAIAETGTVILDHGPGQGRRALTLLPDVHLVVVRSDQIVAAVPDAIAALRPGAVQTWISGPSATSDIELNRVEGVHGPRTLIVLIVQ